MDDKFLNKIDKSQLTHIDTNIVDLPNNFKDKIDTLKPIDDGDTYTPPCIGPARYNTIDLNKFEVVFDTPCFIEPHRVLSVTKPIYNVRKEKYVSNKVMLSFGVYHAFHYFGKPSRYDNFFTDEEIASLVRQFNEEKHKYMEVIEMDSNSDAKIKTVYSAPRIYRIEFPKFDVTKTENKYFIAEVHFNNVSQEVILPETEVIEDKI